MNLIKAIENKNSGGEFSRDELKVFLDGYVSKKIDDKLMTKFIKSIYDHGMSVERIADMTELMMYSGDVIDLSSIEGIKVDKHSTGGVGDKVTMIVAPIVAALGVPVAKMSGRGLGFTGGTLDKLESIPGYNISLTDDELRENVNKHGIAIIGQTGNLVPADKEIYALRDVTGLIDSLPLISSSIMSKKLATGSDAILLDVKCGDAAFMKTEESAVELAEMMISLGKHLGRDVRAEITSMETPLGRAIGNKIEVLEAVKALQGEMSRDLEEVIYSSASTMLVQAKAFKNEEEALVAVKEIIASGKALEKFKEWINSQGGDVEAIFKDNFFRPKYTYEVIAKNDGFVNILSAASLGKAVVLLGGGRVQKTDVLDFDSSIYINVKSGEKVKSGEVVMIIYATNKKIPQEVIDSVEASYEISNKQAIKKTVLRKLS